MADIKYRHKIIEDNGKVELIKLLDGYRRIAQVGKHLIDPDNLDYQRLNKCNTQLNKPLIVQKPSSRRIKGRDLSIDECIDRTIEGGFGRVVKRYCGNAAYFHPCQIWPNSPYTGSLNGILSGRDFFMAGLPEGIENSLKKLAQMRFIQTEVRNLKGCDMHGFDVDLVCKPGAKVYEALEVFDRVYTNRKTPELHPILNRELDFYNLIHYGSMKQILSHVFENKITADDYRTKVIGVIQGSDKILDEFYGEYERIAKYLKMLKTNKKDEKWLSMQLTTTTTSSRSTMVSMRRL